ncbi:hypothetical protein GGS23DRAFT_603831 [Durotheca rogersii]|uniref:uncharacterized protein n=1 Tax=Durotheca rogersii TaxID=419775 RepID=UPI002220FBE9|nr:uncharacterized protein GGS23DRAFT_603831 [Durotheca rogersii]KAI5865193.1 hypothetical protein GGS23DRAFT_603831 [Durotheca rogersii]
MPSRLQKPRTHPVSSREPPAPATHDITDDASSPPKITTAPHDVENTMSTPSASPQSKSATYVSRTYSANGNVNISYTIRTVTGSDEPSDSSSSESLSAQNSSFSSSTRSTSSVTSFMSQQQMHSISSVKLKPQSPMSGSLPSRLQNGDGAQRGESMEEPVDSALEAPDASAVEDSSSKAQEGSPQWDSTVGKAGLGKTGRVINKLVSDNEVLKRDLQIERLKAEEAKQAAKLLEDKMDRVIADYESRLLEANVTKTLLSRKERQVEHLQSAVELEKKRTTDAQERERIWREQLEKSQRETKVQVEEANLHATLMEGRYNAISSHWKDQGEEVKRSAAGLEGKIKTLAEERRADDEKINTLRDLCDQQDANIRDLQRQKEDIARQFEAYKQEQEQALRDIKTAARERTEEHERALDETRRVLGQLKWALNVKQNVKDAQ